MPLSFPPEGVTGTACYRFEYNFHLIKIPSHVNREITNKYMNCVRALLLIEQSGVISKAVRQQLPSIQSVLEDTQQSDES